MQRNLHATLSTFVNDTRILKETSALLDAGLVDEIHVVAMHSGGLPEHEQDDRRSVWRVPLRTRSWPRSFAIQLIKYVEFCVRGLQLAREKKISVVTIHRLALLPLGVLIKGLTGAKLVYDCHELETETFGLSGYRQTVARVMERALVQRADLVVVVSDSIREWYVNAYRLTNIYTVLNCPPYEQIRRHDTLRHELGIPLNRKIVLYLGGLVPGRGVEGLLQAFAQQDDGKHALVFMGYGSLADEVERYARLHPNIYLRMAVPPDDVVRYAASADIGVSYIDNPSLNDRYCLPNKLFQYVMAGLPVMVNDAPEQRRFAEERRVGVVLRELSPAAVRDGLERIEAMNRGSLGEDIRKTAKDYSWESQARIWNDAHRRHIFA